MEIGRFHDCERSGHTRRTMVRLGEARRGGSTRRVTVRCGACGTEEVIPDATIVDVGPAEFDQKGKLVEPASCTVRHGLPAVSTQFAVADVAQYVALLDWIRRSTSMAENFGRAYGRKGGKR